MAAKSEILGRKVNASRQYHEARSMTPTKALRRALSRAADEQWDLALIAQGVERAGFDQDECVAQLTDEDLLILLEGPGGSVGLAAISRQVVMGLVEVQTMGIVLPHRADDRPFTVTDAALVAPLLDETLLGLEQNLDGMAELGLMGGYRFGAMIDTKRNAGLILEAAEFQGYRVDVDLAGGCKTGAIQFLFPVPDISDPETAQNEVLPSAHGPHEDMFRAVPAQVTGILCRVRVPLSEAGKLKKGDILHLPADAVTTAEVFAGKDHKIADGRLGQLNGFLAIRLDLPGSQESENLPNEVWPASNHQGQDGPRQEVMVGMPASLPNPRIEAQASDPAVADMSEAQQTSDYSELDVGFSQMGDWKDSEVT